MLYTISILLPSQIKGSPDSVLSFDISISDNEEVTDISFFPLSTRQSYPSYQVLQQRPANAAAKIVGIQPWTAVSQVSHIVKMSKNPLKIERSIYE